MPTRKNFPANKKRRQTSATERQAESNKLTPEQKLERTTGTKTVAKYTKQVEALAVAAAVAADKKLKASKAK